MTKETRISILIVAVVVVLAAVFLWPVEHKKESPELALPDVKPAAPIASESESEPDSAEVSGPAQQHLDKVVPDEEEHDYTRIVVAPEASVEGVDVSKALSNKVVEGDEVINKPGTAEKHTDKAPEQKSQ